MHRSLTESGRVAAAGGSTPPTDRMVVTEPAANASPICYRNPCLERVAAKLQQAQKQPTQATIHRWLERFHCQPRAIRLHRGANRRALAQSLRAHAQTEQAPLWCAKTRRGSYHMALAAPHGAAILPSPRGFRFELFPPFHDGRIFVTNAAGELRSFDLEELEAHPQGGATLKGDDAFAVQVVAEGPFGIRPVALWNRGTQPIPPFWLHYLREQSSTSTERSEEHAPPRMESIRWDRIPPLSHDTVGDLRARRGLAPLRPNRLLRRIAAKHGTAVCQQQLAAHKLDGRSDPRERLRQAGLDARSVGEVVLFSPDPRNLLRTLLASPSHMATVLVPEFTDLGVAQVLSERGSCVVLSFAGWPRPRH